MRSVRVVLLGENKSLSSVLLRKREWRAHLDIVSSLLRKFIIAICEAYFMCRSTILFEKSQGYIKSKKPFSQGNEEKKIV